MSESIYFFDAFQKLITVVFEESITQSLQEREIKEDKSLLISDILIVETVYKDKIKDAVYMAVKEPDASFTMYRIIKIGDPDNKLQFTGMNFGPDELNGTIVEDIRPNKEAIKSVAERLLTGTGWRVGHVDGTIGAVSGSFYYVSVKEALKNLQSMGCEILFKCTVDGDGVSGKWIEIYKQIGTASNKRFTYGETALSVVKEQDNSQVFTSLIGRGRGEEVGDGYGRRIEYKDIEWRIANGDPLDKPKGQNWLEIPEMTARLGIPSKDGSMRKREQVVIFEDIEDPKELLQATYDQLVATSRPLVQFKTNVLGGDAIGNTVPINRYDRGYSYRARVFKTKLDRLTGVSSADLGDNINKTSVERLVANEKGLTILDESKMTFYESTEVSKYQDDIMRGAGSNGGSVYQVNGIEAGVSDSREVYETVYMDGPSIGLSRHFMIENNSGISFKICKLGEWQTIKDVHNGPSETAWTIDGTFNANFIRAGKIMAEIFETSFNGVGDALKLMQGILAVYNESIKIMELNRNGLDFWNNVGSSVKHLGRMGTAGKQALESVADYGKDYTGNGLFIDLDQAVLIQIANQQGQGFQVYKNGIISSEVKDDPTGWYHKGNFSVDGIVRANKLFVGGQEVTPGGQGGGGWNGQYPPEITTQAEKYAWQLWMTLLPLGYSKAAIAGILGNVQGEVGASMNPDTEQVGGPAYGCVQWDGSAYPLAGPPTWNGRQYVQTLMSTASINESYVTMVAQGKLIDWCMYNGQWIGAVSPTTVAGFKAETSAANAARAFELNFERPAAAHPERQGWAIEWYNKFVNLVPPTSSGDFIKPLDAPVIITSEYGWRESPTGGGQELHNGIDLVNNNNSAPIYASNSGTVVFSASGWNGGYGNYIVIQHKPNLFTGYGHNSQLLVSVGATVTKGQKIAIIGESGNVTGIHTHFQFMEGTDMWSGHVNPRKYIDF